MKVIALKGKSGTGKSHTLNIVYSLLLKIGYTQVPGNYEELGNKKFEDIIDILILNGVLVGIIGMGDYGLDETAGLDSLLKRLELENCKIVICACRSEEKIERCVELYQDHTFIEKTESSRKDQYRIVNYEDAERLIAAM